MSAPDGTIADLRRRTEELEIARQRATEVTASAESRDGTVDVTVDGTGGVTGIRLAPNTFDRTTPDRLARAITEVAQAAAQDARARTAALFGVDSAPQRGSRPSRPSRAVEDDDFADDRILG